MAEKLKYSPLIEALCEFRFVPSSSWDWTIPGRLYDEIRSDFPERAQVDGLAVQFVLGPEKTSAQPVIKGPERVQMKRSDGTAMVQVGPNLLVVNHLRPYSDWESFCSMISDAYAKHEKIIGPTKVARIGLRYINQIPLPASDGRLEEITTLAQKLPGALDRPVAGIYHRFELNQDKPNGMLVLQLGTQRTEQGNFLMLDLDIGSSPNEVFMDATSISSWLHDAHERIDDAFFASVVPALLEKWKRGEK